jgi:hypothetical protein
VKVLLGETRGFAFFKRPDCWTRERQLAECFESIGEVFGVALSVRGEELELVVDFENGLPGDL